MIRKDAIDKVNKKDMEIEVAKREDDEIKRKAHEYAVTTKKKTEEDTRVMQSLVKTKIISDAEPRKKEKVRSKSVAPRMRETPSPPQPPQPQPVQPQQNLIQLSYTEQLKQRLREQQLQRLMSDTFG